MTVVRSSLRDFRNYERAEVHLGPGLTVVCGPNGAGKTNLLEALYFALTGRSCRTSNEREMVRIGASVARVELELDAEDGRHLIEVGFEPGEDKRVRVDGAVVSRADLAPARPLASVFLPDRLDLVKGAPTGRRGHLDQFVAAMWPARGDARLAYARTLSQRNALVARVRAGAAPPELLDPWDAELARHGEHFARLSDPSGDEHALTGQQIQLAQESASCVASEHPFGAVRSDDDLDDTREDDVEIVGGVALAVQILAGRHRHSFAD